MTRFEKLQDIDAMVKFLDIIIYDCDFCPCNVDDACDGNPNCIEKLKAYLLEECGEEPKGEIK